MSRNHELNNTRLPSTKYCAGSLLVNLTLFGFHDFYAKPVIFILYYTGPDSNKSRESPDVFSGEKKRMRHNFGECSPFYKGLKMGGIVLHKIVFDSGLFGDGFGTFRDTYKTKNAN